MVGPFLDPLNAVLEDPDLNLILDDLTPEHLTVWVGLEFPGSNGEILPLLFQVPLKGIEEVGVLGLYSPPLHILWPLLDIWVRREILRLELSGAYCV